MATTKTKVLIVDDDSDMAGLVESILVREGFEVFKVHSAEQATSQVRHVVPDIILLDVMMPGVSGLEFSRFVQRDPDLQHVKIIIISARGQTEDVAAGLSAGASKYLVKPFKPEELLAALDDVS